MAARGECSLAIEWEVVEETGEEDDAEILATGGEEAGRGVGKIKSAWTRCPKLKTDQNFHQRYIPVGDALAFKVLSSEDKDGFVKARGLADEDRLFLDNENAVKCLERFSDAVVCITIKLVTATHCGTGVFVRINGDDAIITNAHSIRTNSSGDGLQFSSVKPKDVRVFFLYNSETSAPICREVSAFQKVSLPDKNKADDVLKESITGNLNKSESADAAKVNIALSLLSSYFGRRDTFLDYALLYLTPIESEEDKAKTANIKPLEMKAFQKLENFRNVSSFEFADPRQSKYPRALRLFTISHPHQASKQVSFGGMESNLSHVYFLNMTYGKNDTGMLSGKDPFLDHSVATCPGSSGAPVFAFVVNHDTGEVEVDEAVYFLHFFGEARGNLFGKAVSCATIIRNMELQATHDKLRDAIVDV